ncbi:MAG: ABC transporter ATP-binding protein [Gammaproteobacteria bacterium RIFCSPHIGHO2_12_FULL_40_19]|nr:MAG: ABC transporter ATP-binding protein [Gammaproteobacteria bacterium RIFCSPHIGHO2_12_FULL_40_19]
MTNLITLENVSLAYGLDLLLDKVKLQITSSERVCLIGRNGAGKSSLLKIIDNTILPDSGIVWRKSNLRLARLEQELPKDSALTIYEYVAGGLEKTGALLAEYHLLTQQLSHSSTPKDFSRLEQLQQKIDAANGWRFEESIKAILQRLSLDPEAKLIDLSGGWQRRAALAKALVSAPELLLLDEPTNHLDMNAVSWLEEELLTCHTALLFVTHDRALIQRLSTRIIELDRGQLSSWPGNYYLYLRHKEELLHAEEKQHANFDKKLAQEEQWIRQGIKARRTRNEGRVRALYRLREDFSKRRLREGQVAFQLNDADKSGDLVFDARHVSYDFGKHPLIKNFSCRIMRGDKIGLIGPNGIGKSTLLNLLLGHLHPQQGTIHQGTKLKIAYFDQLRNQLEPEKSVMENVLSGSEFLEINGKRQHIISYLADFLFTPDRARTPVKALSGGEANRLFIARLFSQPSNLLVMDEPTNDLDIETLELLEEQLSRYQGTLLLVSHDRTFLDNVVTSTLVFEGDGVIKEYIGGYQEWLRQRKNVAQVSKNLSSTIAFKQKQKPTKLSFKDQKELDGLPAKIEELEKLQLNIETIMSSAAFYKQTEPAIIETRKQLNDIQQQLEKAYLRWSELETMMTQWKD